MSLDFEADWLALRETADHRARENAATEAAAHWAAGLSHLRILDLGAGRGSNMRFLAPILGPDQCWTLADHDSGLLEQAAASAPQGIEVSTRNLDLRTADLKGLIQGFDLVTAAALLDLVSADWLSRFIAAAGEAGAALLIATSVDGRVKWSPSVDDDAKAAEAFSAHQNRDKGFGGALGTAAPGKLAELLRGGGWRVVPAQADWRLAIGEAALQRAYLDGVRSTLAETDFDRATADRWRTARVDLIEQGQSGLTVGHLDVFALRSKS